MNLALIAIPATLFLLYEELNKNKLKWKNKDAVEQYGIIKSKYGKPNIIDHSEGGIAIWFGRTLSGTCFDRIELIDESVPHCVPAPHRDYLYSYVNYEVPNDKVLDVISLSGSVSYDPLKKLLRARCGSEEANIATLYLAVSIGSGVVSLKKVQNEKLYKKTILSTVSSQNVEIYYNKLCKLLKSQTGNPKWSGYFPLAFPEGCCKGYNPVTNSCDKIGKEFLTKPFVKPTHFEHSLEDHKEGRIMDHTMEQHLADKPDKSERMRNVTDKPDKSNIDPNIKPVLF